VTHEPEGLKPFRIEIPETDLTDLRYWNEPDKGGHFAAFAQPASYVDEVRAFFRLVR
jgi:hypothetical protein